MIYSLFTIDYSPLTLPKCSRSQRRERL